MSGLKERSYFRPDIEGLRAVAIGAVLLFHAGVPFADGGFIGVDVFFVISGFLITGLLVREWNGSGRIDLAVFYARRFRRLLPAALLTIVVTTLASWLVLSELRFPSVAADSAAAALYVSNIRFANEAIDYLGSEVAPSPLLHFWSLSVEEQFYLFWPLLVLVAMRLLGAARLWLVVTLIVAGSLVLAVAWTDIAAPWAFFSLPTRAWQLGVGGLIAVGVLRLPRRTPAPVAGGLVWLGLGIIVAGVADHRHGHALPGHRCHHPGGGHGPGDHGRQRCRDPAVSLAVDRVPAVGRAHLLFALPVALAHPRAGAHRAGRGQPGAEPGPGGGRGGDRLAQHRPLRGTHPPRPPAADAAFAKRRQCRHRIGRGGRWRARHGCRDAGAHRRAT